MAKIAFIIATKDRPGELQRLLNSLVQQTGSVEQVIIVDSSESPRDDWWREESELGLPMEYHYFQPPSTSKQRNFGLTLIEPAIEWVGFLDDDVVLEKTAVEEIKKAIHFLPSSDEVAGLGFNLSNHPPLEFRSLKYLPFVEKLGLYSQKRGAVLSSGFQTLIGTVSKNTPVEWLPSTAVIWRKELIANQRFDEFFSGYGYLEDLDFSYSLGRKYRLLVIARAKYYHFPAESGRGNPFVFGVREVINRIYFVKKHKELSLGKCYVALVLRCKMSLWLALRKARSDFLLRAAGNVWGMFRSVKLIFQENRECGF